MTFKNLKHYVHDSATVHHSASIYREVNHRRILIFGV